MADENETPDAEERTEEVVLKAYRQRKKVMIQLEEDGEPRAYYIHTMTGAEKAKWQNDNAGRVKYDAKGTPIGVTKYDGMESGLIHVCLRDDNGKQIPKGEIDLWGSPTLIALSKACLEFNGLTTKGEAEKKE